MKYNHVQQHKSQQLEQLDSLSEPTDILFHLFPIGTVKTSTMTDLNAFCLPFDDLKQSTLNDSCHGIKSISL